MCVHIYIYIYIYIYIHIMEHARSECKHWPRVGPMTALVPSQP